MTDQKRDMRVATLLDRLNRHGLSRRKFMEGAMAAGMTAAAASTLWSDTARAEGPKRGGHFRIGMQDGNTTDSLDPGTTESTFMIDLNHGVRSYLTEITEDNVVGPDAAESWEASDDASVWTFKLFEGVEFHNGKTFTAADARDSLNFHRAEDSKSAAKPLLESVEEIIADDDRTLTVKLTSGSADFPYVLTDYHMVMMPSDGEGNVDFASGIGTGGYAIESFDPGVHATFKRHENFFKPDHAWFDSAEFIAIPDSNTRMTAVTTDEVDAITNADLKTAHMLSRDPNVTVLDIPSGGHATMAMHVDVPPFDNNDVRLALKLAIDREEILQKILRGHGTIGNDHPIGPTLPYWSELPQREYDPDKAKHHLKKAGMENLKVSFSTSEVPFPGATDAGILYQEQAKAAGIDVNVVRESNDGYWSNVWLVKPFCMVGWGQRPTPDVMFTLGYAADAPWNETHFKDERFNSLLLEARKELNDERRVELYREMMLIVRDEGGTIVPFFNNWVYAHRANVQHGEQVSGNWPLDGHRALERWWFA